MLNEKGVLCWIDEEQMEGNIVERMSEGIENSITCVVFVTKNYRDKVNGKNAADNCKKEFMFAERTMTVDLMVPVVMEPRDGAHPEMRRPTEWGGALTAMDL